MAEFHALMMFTKAPRSPGLQEKLRVAIRSLVKHSEFQDNQRLHLHLVSDTPSQTLGQHILQQTLPQRALPHQVTFHDVDSLTDKLFPIVEAMQKLFSAGSGAYYSDSIFFLSVAMHRIMPPVYENPPQSPHTPRSFSSVDSPELYRVPVLPWINDAIFEEFAERLPFATHPSLIREEMTRIVQLDLDVEYRTNIRDLFKEFDNFEPEAVIGIARELQPVYRHALWQYRRENPGTRVGEPPPGFPGFNSGVMLLDLGRMRRSALYNKLLEPENVRRLAEKYHFKGHLGDQDFFTLAGMEHPGLFHQLNCTWNRQLCTWWRDHGYADVFDLYFQCRGKVNIYHGNCNTPIPEE